MTTTARTQHTHGPWRIFKYSNGKGLEIGTSARKVAVTTWTKDAEDEANARLIAAAPELLQALNGFKWLGNNLHNIKGDPDRFREFYESALKDAKAAIAKATGEMTT